MEACKIVLAEDNEIYREGLCEFLREIPGVEVGGVALNGAALLELVAKEAPQVVLTDIQMPVMNGIEATRLLLKSHPSVGVIALTMFPDEKYLVDMLAAGARGYLYKNCTEEDLAAAVEAVFHGDFYQCRTTMRRVSKMLTGSRFLYAFREGLRLTVMERRIIELACAGYLSKQIAPEVGLSLQTLHQYRSGIIEKLGVKSWTGVIVYAVQHGLVGG